MQVPDESLRAAAADISLLLANYWFEVDANHGANAPAFYTEDCLLEVGSDRSFRGREGVKEFYRYRKDRGVRTTCHVFSNLRVACESADIASADFVVVNYASDGPAPVVGLEGPALVSRVSIRCRREADGCWRFAALRGDPLFIGAEPYTVSVLVDGDHEAKVGA